MNLIDAIEAGDVKKMKQISEDKLAFQESLSFVDKDGRSPIHFAAKNACTNLMKGILSTEEGLKTIDKKDEIKGWTPLIYAIYSQDDGGPEIVSMLLDHKADPNIPDKENNIAVHHAAGYGFGSNDALEHLFNSKKSNVNAQNLKGETPAHIAIRESQMWAFLTILKTSCKLDLKTEDGETLAHYAVRSIGNSPKFLELLLKNGGDLNLRNNSGKTPYDLAKEKGDSRTLKFLKDYEPKENMEKDIKKALPEAKTGQATPIKVEQKKPSDSSSHRQILYFMAMVFLPIILNSLYNKFK